MSEELTKTVYACNVCGEEYDYRRDAIECHPDIVEKEKPMIRYKTRSGEMKTVEKQETNDNGKIRFVWDKS